MSSDSNQTFVKSVSKKEDSDLVYMQHQEGDVFDLRFSRNQHQPKAGDKIVLVQKGKVSHIVEVKDPSMKIKNDQEHKFAMEVKVIKKFEGGKEIKSTSLAEANLTCLGGSTNVVLLDKLCNNPNSVKNGLEQS